MKIFKISDFVLPIICCAFIALTSASDWQKKSAPLMTRWAEEVTPTTVHSEYPRPQLVREQWLNLNGLWQFAIVSPDEAPPFHPNSSLFLDTIKVWLANRKNEKIFYTLDGSIFSAQSRRYREPFILTETSVVKVRSIGNDGSESAVCQAYFEKTKLQPPIPASAKLSPGLSYQYFEGQWSLIPDFSTLSAGQRGVVDQINLLPRQRDDLKRMCCSRSLHFYYSKWDDPVLTSAWFLAVLSTARDFAYFQKSKNRV